MAKQQDEVHELGRYQPSRELWELNIGELAGHNIETAGREEVNQMLQEGWILLTSIRSNIGRMERGGSGRWRSWASQKSKMLYNEFMIN